MRKILLILAHPAFERSRVNRRLFDEVRGLPGVTARDLYDLYPHFDVDVRTEQRLLEEHDIVILQHPFFWYSAPALIKEWIDLVFQHGWAYGTQGNALRGKIMLQAISAGGSEAGYQEGGINGHSVRKLLSPFEQAANLCGMTYLAPIVWFGVHGCTPESIDESGQDYRKLVEALRDDRIGLDLAKESELLRADSVQR